ncbi:MAG: YihY/virulence factor BrkB family protein [Bacillota bacterium]|nr:YihY/virulence factor BrkB family protein [Bacillota bacterium]
MKKRITKLLTKISENELYQRIMAHDVISYSAQSAYYLMLAIFPFIILIFMFLTVLGIDYIDQVDKLLSALPDDVIPTIKEYLVYSKKISTSFFSPLLLTSVLISSGAITSLVKAFNIANDIKEGRSFFKQKLLSAVFLVSLVVIFTITLLISSVGLELLREIFDTFGIRRLSASTFKALIFLIDILFFFFIVCLMYYVLPAKKLSFKNIMPGALFATPSIVIISNLFGIYINNFTRYSVVYGSLSSIILLMIFLFFCALLLILGEEINVIVRNRASKK